MRKLIGILVILAIVITCMAIPSTAEDLEINQPPGKLYAALFDLLVVKPIFTGGALGTTSVFVGTLPFTYAVKLDLQSSQFLVQKPWTYVTDRPLGIFFPGKSIAARIDEKISDQYLEYFVQAGADRSPLLIK